VRVLLAGSGLFAAAFCLHLALWRIRAPRRQIRALLRLFYGSLAAALLLGWAAGLPALQFTPPEAVHLLLFFTGLTLAYIITYTAVQVDSPSLTIVSLIAAGGEAGLDREALFAQLTDEQLVRPRLEDLVRDEVVAFDGRVYRLLRRGGLFLSLIVGWRRLMGLPIRGG
jgi:hypothetical protein